MKIDNAFFVRCIVGLAIAGAALGLAQMWLSLFSYDIFIKLMITLLVLGLVISFVIAVRRDLTEEKRLKDDKYLD